MIITPNSAYAKNLNLLPVNSTNFPALKVYFPCDEISGTRITDKMGGVYHDDASNIAFDSTFNGMSCNIAVGTAPTSAPGIMLPDAGTAAILIIAAGVMSSTRTQTTFSFGLGDTTGVNPRALFTNNTTGAGTCAFCDGAVAISSTALSANSANISYGYAAAYARGVTMQTRRYPSLTGASVAQTSGASLAGSSSMNGSFWQRIRMAGVFNGFAAFFFTSGLPVNWESGASDTAQQWINGYKGYISPIFKNIA